MEFQVFPEKGKVRFDCAGASGLGFRALIFCVFRLHFCSSFLSSFFVCFLGSPGSPKHSPEKVGGTAGTPLLELNRAHSESSFMQPCSLRSGASPYSLKGSFGEPAAGSTSPSASTRPREFVFVLAVRSWWSCC